MIKKNTKTLQRILIVEDNLADSNLLIRYLKELTLSHMTYLHCETANRALTEGDRFNPDVAFVDYVLGDNSGIEVITNLKKRSPQTVFVLLTGVGNEQTAIDAIRAGANDYLFKNELSPNALERIIRFAIEQRQAAVKIEEERSFLQSIVDGMTDLLAVIDLDLKVVRANKALADFMGVDRKELIGKHCCEVIYHSDVTYPECFCKDISFLKKTIIRELKDDRIGHDWIVTGIPLFDDNGEVTSVVHISKDITEWKKSEKKLRQSHKMEALGTLSGGIAHDFNNILTSILGYTEIAIHNEPENIEVCNSLKEIRKSSNRAAELTNQILAFNRDIKPALEPIELAPTINGALKLIRVSLPPTTTIHCDIDEKAGLVMANTSQILQVVTNLCVNAEHAMREKGGTLSVILNSVNVNTELVSRLTNLKEGPYIKLTVSDTGHGMNNRIKEKIFERFFTTKKPDEGTGMGLAITHEIIEEHDGAITVESEPDKGTTFEIYLPKTEICKTVEGLQTHPVPQGRESILFVDDEVTILNMGKEILEDLGYKVTTTNDSINALNTFEAEPERFDIVITDQAMPGMTGEDLAKELINIRKEIPIILFTGYSSIFDTLHANKIGIKGFIMKPLKRRTLAELIRKVLDENRVNVGRYGEKCPDKHEHIILK
ncbi:MAG: hybrid sensor histidine kinase/response regulator [Planctomycetota bacterium]|jgi:PAS domain S-box-containing protein